MSVQIPLHGKHGQSKFALVDDEDASWVNLSKWYVSHGYVLRFEGKNRFQLSVEIMEPPPGKVVDHKNGDPLDNRRSNLRVVTQGQNTQNRIAIRAASGKRGVYRHWRKWYGKVETGGTVHRTKLFDTLEEADAAVRELRRELLPFSEN